MCGLLAGLDNHIVYAIQIKNIAENLETEYRLDPADQLQATQGVKTIRNRA